jgi:hypothetical protein
MLPRRDAMLTWLPEFHIFFETIFLNKEDFKKIGEQVKWPYRDSTHFQSVWIF